jgi:hypothetical protein
MQRDILDLILFQQEDMSGASEEISIRSMD